jgi:uncharacterized protein
MSLIENKQLVRAFYEAGNRGDMEQCLTLLAEDVTWTNIGSMKYSGVYRGKATVITKLLQPVFGQLKAGIASTVDNMIGEGDFVAVQLRGKAETRDGRPYNNTYCHVFTIRGGEIVAVTEYLDTQLAADVLTA